MSFNFAWGELAGRGIGRSKGIPLDGVNSVLILLKSASRFRRLRKHTRRQIPGDGVVSSTSRDVNVD